jgi:hypothetical protein
LTFIDPCIVIYSYSKTNNMHQFLKLFILVKHSTGFGRSCRPSSGAQACTYNNRHMSNSWCYLLLAGTRRNYNLRKEVHLVGFTIGTQSVNVRCSLNRLLLTILKKRDWRVSTLS